MSNVLNSGAQNANQATAPTPRVNDVPVGLPDGRNNFDMSFDNYLTARYGTILPFHFFQAYERDKVTFSSRHEVRSYTMAAPWMGSAYLHKHYFAVPMPALLRRNWQKIQVQPLKGDDVPKDANCVIPRSRLSSLITDFNLATSLTSPLDKLRFYLLKFFVLEYIYSPSSLINLLGSTFYRDFDELDSYDKASQDLLSFFNSYFEGADKFVVSIDGKTYGNAACGPNDAFHIYKSFPAFLDLLREHLDFKIVVADDSSGTLTEFFDAFDVYFRTIESTGNTLDTAPFNYQYALAYQCVCSQFYTNDHIDNLYTWELYEQAAQSVYQSIGADVKLPTFKYNGVDTLYDVFSGKMLDGVIEVLGTKVDTPAQLEYFMYACIYMQYLFGTHNSLVYGDYFHAAKATPLAAVDVNSPVVSEKVSAIDVTKSIVMQRFGNAVQKAGQRFKDYVGAVLGGNVSPDYHEPKWIVGNTFLLGANEIENTANNQGNVVQNIRTSADNWVYETEFGMQSIVLGLFYFNTPSVYSRALFRENLQADRFDYFNPRLQNIGDQPVYSIENSYNPSADSVFGYQTRNADMKQRFSIARGGFIGSLPSWAFIIDSDNDRRKLAPINSDYIRDVPSDFDRFYSSLTGFTLANRFHMIFKFSNECHAARNMQITPTIL